MNASITHLSPQAKVNQNQQVDLSFEFFPAKTPRMERNLWRTMGQLELLNPAFFSMTYGALGSERDHSLGTVSSMAGEGVVPVAAHLTGAGHTHDELLELAQHFRHEGVKRLVALRGDADPVANGVTDVAGMVECLLTVDDFDISVAAYPEVHPEALSPADDLMHLKRKLDAGAKRAITQYFFDAEVFLRFRDAAEKAGISQPIVPGILPVHDFDKVLLFSMRCGASVPAFMDDLFTGTTSGSSEQRQVGIEQATQLCERLLEEGVDALHFYTLNQPNMSFEVARNLGFAEGNDLVISKAA